MKWLSMISYYFSIKLLQEKLKRLIRYLNFKEIKNKSQKQTSQDDDEVLEASGKKRQCNLIFITCTVVQCDELKIGRLNIA